MEPHPMPEVTATPEQFIKEFLVPANVQAIRCVDERHAENQTNGIQIQGATSGIVDALKTVQGKSEDSAWKMVTDAGIPLDGHDDTHKGPDGCGYNNRVETDPKSVGAPEPVPAASRLARVDNTRILHYHGDHAPKYASINFIPNTTLDTNAILEKGIGTFNLDAWALFTLASKLGLSHNEQARFVTSIVDSYKQTVTTLTKSGITTFVELRR